jgi:hypothetical protein
MKGINTYFALLAEFGTGQIPLKSICRKFFGLSEGEACKRAAMNRLPIPAYRAGSQKAEWLVDAAELAALVDAHQARALAEWKKTNGS